MEKETPNDEAPAAIASKIISIAAAAKERTARRNGDSAQLDLPIEELLPVETGQSKYPTLLTRVPLFSPVANRTVLDTDWIKGEVYATPWGSIRRIGPGLDIYDEDTLIALFRLCRSRKLHGKREALPIPALRVVDDEHGERREGGQEEASVYIGTTTAYAVNRFLGRDTGGKDLRACRESIQRLGVTSLFFHKSDLHKEGKTGFFDYIGDDNCHGEITIQFRPAMYRLMESNYTYIDIAVRRQLSDVGKSVHKFLSSQPQEYAISLDKLMAVVRYAGDSKEFKRVLMGTTKKIGQLEKMKRLEWIKSYEISGTGRKTPFILRIWR
jgi:hypothetical protein